jgi:hypothetical protein
MKRSRDKIQILKSSEFFMEDLMPMGAPSSEGVEDLNPGYINAADLERRCERQGVAIE